MRRFRMHHFRAAVRRTLAFAAYYSGLVWLYAAVALRNRAVVLMYHRVLPGDADSFSSDGIVVSPATFSLHLGFLTRHFSVLSAGAFRDCLDRRAFPHRACLITFDDGWFDNERYALPILQQHGLPAVLFAATGYIDGPGAFWQEELTRMLFIASRSVGRHANVLNELGLAELAMADALDARHGVRAFVTELKSRGPAEIDRVHRLLTDALALSFCERGLTGDDRFLSWNELREMANSGRFTVASHGHTHRPLPQLGRSGAAEDLLRSTQELELQGFHKPWMCAYPNGDHDADVMEVAQSVGFTIGFTTLNGRVSIGDDPMRLKRVNIHDWTCSSQPEFFCHILGLF